jgi:hypothetical protein
MENLNLKITPTSPLENADQTYVGDEAGHKALLLEALAEIHVLKKDCCDGSWFFTQPPTLCLKNQFSVAKNALAIGYFLIIIYHLIQDLR